MESAAAAYFALLAALAAGCGRSLARARWRPMRVLAGVSYSFAAADLVLAAWLLAAHWSRSRP